MFSAFRRTLERLLPSYFKAEPTGLTSLSETDLDRRSNALKKKVYGGYATEDERDEYFDLWRELDRRHGKRMTVIRAMSDSEISTQLSRVEQKSDEQLLEDGDYRSYELTSVLGERQRNEETEHRKVELRKKPDARLTAEIAFIEKLLDTENYVDPNRTQLRRWRTLIEERARRDETARLGERQRDRLKTYAAIFAAGAAVGALVLKLINMLL